MKIKDFIKILQEADPSGEAYIRLEGGVPYGAELKPGYYDGSYTYINDKNQFVFSTKDSKVDLYCKETHDIVYDVIEKWNPFTESEDGLWDKVKEQFVFEFPGSSSQMIEEKKERYFRSIKEDYDRCVAMRRNSWNEALEKIIQLYKDGCRFFRKKDVRYIYYDEWFFINKEDSKKVGDSNLYHTYPILKSGKFKAVEVKNPKIGIFKYFTTEKDWYEYVLIED